MDFSLIFNALKEFIDRSSSELAAFLIGLGVGIAAFLSPWLYRRLFGRRSGDAEKDAMAARCERLDSEKRKIELQLDGERKRVEELSAELEAKAEELLARVDEVQSLDDENSVLRSEIAQLNEQLEKLTKLDGDVWQQRPSPEQVPAFRQLAVGRPPIIAVVNLKGGVGKTTVSANLSAAAMQLGLAPLLVDLDYQNSLSGLTLSAQVRDDIKQKGQVVSRLIDTPAPTGADVLHLAQRIGETNGFVLAAEEDLTTVEMQVMARWITGGTSDDVRFRLRQALHSDEVQSQFDLVLIDCPPRLTTACVNALACCDYVLIPALLDSVSTEAVPRLLRWLRLFKSESRICPDMSVVGVVGNRARNAQGMSTKQKQIWSGLEVPCRDAWGEAVYLFATALPENVGFADAANNNAFAADTDKLRPVFLDLFSELRQRIPFHAGQGSSTVSH